MMSCMAFLSSLDFKKSFTDFSFSSDSAETSFLSTFCGSWFGMKSDMLPDDKLGFDAEKGIFVDVDDDVEGVETGVGECELGGVFGVELDFELVFEFIEFIEFIEFEEFGEFVVFVVFVEFVEFVELVELELSGKSALSVNRNFKFFRVFNTCFSLVFIAFTAAGTLDPLFSR